MNNDKFFTVYRITAYFHLVLGILHSAMIPVFYDSLTPTAFFSLGTGIGLIFLGMLNIAASKLLVKWLLTMTLIANILVVLYSSLSLLVINDPQAYFGVSIFIIVLITCLIARIKLRASTHNKL